MVSEAKPYKSVLLTELHLDLSKALQLAQAMETASKQTVELQGATSGHYVCSSTTKASTNKSPSRQLQTVKKAWPQMWKKTFSIWL